MRRCLVKGSVLRSVACLPGATNSTLPKNLHNSQGFKDIHGDLYVWRYIWEYVCVEERVSEAPPAVVRRICGYVELYVWWWERESEKEGEGMGGGGRERNNPSGSYVTSSRILCVCQWATSGKRY